MKNRLTLVVVVCARLALPAVTAEETAQQKSRMDDAMDIEYDLRDALTAKALPKAAETADKLAKIGEDEERYWVKAQFDDVLSLARENLAAAREIAATARAGKADEAAEAFARLDQSCKSCHDLHPEKRANR